MLSILHSWRIWCLDSIGYDPHGQLKFSLGKNLRWYLPIGAWLVITLVALIHKEFKWPRSLSQVPWKYICHFCIIKSYSSFLLKSHDNLHGKFRMQLKCWISLSTTERWVHLTLLGHFQKAIELLEFLLKKALRSCEIVMDCSW